MWKKSITDCQKLAQQHSGKCLSENYIGSMEKLLWECEKKHQWTASYNSIQQGYWCLRCSNDSIEDCQNYAKQKQGRCLSVIYKPKEKLVWQCKKGHQWEAKWNWIKNQKSWCVECLGLKKKTIEDCQALASKKQGKCLSVNIKNNKHFLLWECKEGHRWNAKYNVIQRGHWCPACAKCKKHTIEDCQKSAQEKNGKCLSDIYVNARTKMKWECSKGHQWDAVYSSVCIGQWCLKCKCLNSRLTLEECQKLASQKNGLCLSEVYENMKMKLLWMCELGHKWKANLHQIKVGNAWCPYCSYGKSQKELYQIIKNIFKDYELEYNFRGFDWLKKRIKKSHKMELDIYIPKIKLGIEYDGIQHFEPIDFFGGKKTFKRIKENDNIKNKLIQSHPEDIKIFIRIPYWENITEENIRDIFKKNKVL